MDEIEIMRQQLTAIKRQLDTQQIVNKELLRKVMRSKASWLNRFVNIEIITLPVVYLLFVIISAAYGVSQWYAFSFLIMSALDTAFDWRTVRIPSDMFGSASILELKKFLLRQKRERFIQVCVGAPLCVIWVVAFFLAMVANIDVTSSDDLEQMVKTGGLIGGLAGGVVGGVVMIVLYRKMQRTNDTLLRDIRDLEEDMAE